MPRPRKCRKVCHFPNNLIFTPLEDTGLPSSGGEVVMSVDEYEAIRLIDREGFSQEECAASMRIARTTVQQIYSSARQKLAEVLVDGLVLRIDGGDYELCDGRGADCRFDGCFKHTIHQQYNKSKGDRIMRIAVTYDNGQIFQHFGHTEFFKVYDVEDGKIVASEVVSTCGQGHGALAGVLNALNADVLICGGIGGGAQRALAAAGVQLYGGVSGDADAAVEALLAGQLAYNPNVMCNHHGDHHHHDCGSHGEEGHHGCGGGHSCH